MTLNKIVELTRTHLGQSKIHTPLKGFIISVVRELFIADGVIKPFFLLRSSHEVWKH